MALALRTTNTLAPAVPSVDDLVAAARALKPMIAEAASAYRGQADVPAEIVAAMKQAGLHRPYMPRRFGGYELDWGAHYRISREIAEADGSAGWLASLVFSHIFFIGRFPLAAQEAFFAASPDPILATASAGGGVLQPAHGGMRLSGRWSFSSGVVHAGGFMTIAKEGDGPLFTHFVLLLPGEYRIEKTWASDGMAASGSHDVVVENVFVPEERLVERDLFLGRTPPGGDVHPAYYYRVRPAPYQKSWFMGPLLGTARGALAAYLVKTRNRKGRIFGESVAEQVPVQVGIGTAVAEIDTAELVFADYARQLHTAGVTGTDLLGEELLRGKRSVIFASRLCLSAIDRLLDGMGVGGQATNNVVQRHYRDCRAVTSHVELNWHQGLAPTGKHRLGLPTGDPLIDGDMAEGAGGTLLGTQI